MTAPRVSALPPLRIAVAHLLRGALLWLLLRGVLAAVMRDFTLALAAPASLFVVAAVAVLALADARVMRESLFHANLGVPPSLAPLLAASAALMLELAARVFG